MNAELIAIGSELLRFGRRDTNSDWLTGRLNGVGYEVIARTIVDDDIERIVAAVRGALKRADVVLVTGGLGPTEDDRTREALSRALELPLERDPAQVRRLEERAKEWGLTFLEGHARQADRPQGSRWLENPIGSAAGMIVSWGSARLVALPGVPSEMKAMVTAELLPILACRGDTLFVRELHVAGRSESAVDRKVESLYGAAGLDVTILSGFGCASILLRGKGSDADEARQVVAAAETRVREILGEDIYGVDDQTLTSVLGELLTARGLRCATAESCTAGLLAAALTDEPGSSNWFRGGLVVYEDELKVRLAGVRPETLAEHGAVSEAVALELAEGVQVRLGAEIGVGITGIAGPGGGTPDKPVGRVHLAIRSGSSAQHWKLNFTGDRNLVRRRTVAVALDRIRRVVFRSGSGG